MLRIFGAALGALLIFSAPAIAQQARPAAAPAAPILDAAALVGPPPTVISARQAADTLAMHPQVSPERLARAQADQAFSPWTALAPVFDANFTATRLPRLKRVYDAITAVLGPAFGQAKAAYARRRPFLEDAHVLQCDPPNAELTASGSYPSGHSAAGWSWALVTAELLPSRTDALLQRGRDYGDSRVICGFHYPSDIDSGRVLGAALLARLHGDAQFRRDMDAARRELARAYPAPQAGN